jgi:hypothetical protein
MNTTRLLRLTSLVLLAGMSVLFSGCDTCSPGKPGPIAKYNIQVNLDQSLKDSSMLVDLVGVNSTSLPSWEAYSMTKYWQTGDAKRADAFDKFTVSFVSGKSLSDNLKVTDPLWNKWMSRGVTHVLVLANLPGAARADHPGNQDPRRQILPLGQCTWAKGTNTLNVLVQQSGIEILTPTRNVMAK